MGVGLEARHEVYQITTLHFAASGSNSRLATVRELIEEHYADLFAVDRYGNTPFDATCFWGSGKVVATFLLGVYRKKLAQKEGRCAVHAILGPRCR